MKEYVGVRRTMGVRKVVLRGEISKQRNTGTGTAELDILCV